MMYHLAHTPVGEKPIILSLGRMSFEEKKKNVEFLSAKIKEERSVEEAVRLIQKVMN